jgi:TRAP-type transport system periplasmic protein
MKPLFTRLLLPAALSLALVLPPAALAKELKFASFVPPQYVLHKPIFQKMADDVAAATGGDLTIRLYPSGELGKGPREQYLRAVKGIADITMGVTGYTSSLFPRTLLIELPGVARDGVDATARMWKVMDRYLASEYQRTRVLAAYATPPSVFMTTKVAVRFPADVRGLKIRTPSRAAGEILKAYGASPVQMPANKVYTAMSTGVIDGALMGSDSLLIFKLIEPARYVTVGLPAMPTALYIVIGTKAWNDLSPSQKKALSAASGRDLSLRAARLLDAFGKRALKIFASREGKEVITLDSDAAAAFARIAAQARTDLVKSMEAKGIPAGEIIAAMSR